MRHSTSASLRPLSLLLLLLPACTDYSLEAKKGEEVESIGLITVDPAFLDFGQLAPGQETTETFRISSTGEASVKLESIDVELSEAFSLWTDATGSVLEPGSSIDVVVGWTPLSAKDTGRVTVRSTAENAVEVVELAGQGLSPQLTLDPTSLEIISFEGSSASAVVQARNTGASDLHLSSWLVQGSDWFTLDLEEGATIAPKESLPLTITFTPQDYTPSVEARLWVSSDDPSGDDVVELLGTVLPPCLGLGEAWSMGHVDITFQLKSGLIVQNTSEMHNVCIDDWYFYLSLETQDSGAGDPFFEPEEVYGQGGSISLAPLESVVFEYALDTEPAWWCVEETQLTQDTYTFSFNGARIPEPLLSYMIDKGNNDLIWNYMRMNPVIAIGRDPGWVTLDSSSTARVELEITNMGRLPALATVSEVIPKGYRANNFSLEPSDTIRGGDGTYTYLWDISLDAAQDTERTEATIYDTLEISYDLGVSPDTCDGRAFTNAPMAEWEDSEGYYRVSEGSPLVVECW